MVSNMETNPEADQLREVNRLRAATISESAATPRGGFAIMAVAIAAFFGGYQWHSRVYDVVAPIVWCAFVAGWVLWLRHGKRAIPGRPARTAHEWRRDAAVWIGLFAAANGVALLGSRVSWLLAGVLMAALSTGGGAVAAWRARHP